MKQLLLILIGSIGICLILASCGSYSDIEKEAIPLVTQILQENLGANAAECVSVEITEKVKKNFYKATAMLTTGEELRITIFLKGEQMIVTVLNN